MILFGTVQDIVAAWKAELARQEARRAKRIAKAEKRRVNKAARSSE